MSHGTHTNESRYTYESSHKRTTHTPERVTILRSHVTHLTESCRTHEHRTHKHCTRLYPWDRVVENHIGRPIPERLIRIFHFPQKSPVISVKFAKSDKPLPQKSPVITLQKSPVIHGEFAESKLPLKSSPCVYVLFVQCKSDLLSDKSLLHCTNNLSDNSLLHCTVIYK